MRSASENAMKPERGAFDTSCERKPAYEFEERCVGLTVRAYIATAAMQGILASAIQGLRCHETIAKEAVIFADKLIAELEKKP